MIGPILSGVDKSIQICSTSSTANDILNMAILAACKVGVMTIYNLGSINSDHGLPRAAFAGARRNFGGEGIQSGFGW